MRAPRFIHFGPFRLDLAGLVLWRGDAIVPLPPKAVELLRVLVENRGQVVTKDDLLSRVWPDTFVEEANLSVNVSTLRKALGAREDGRPYIETLSRRGYRFVDAVGEPAPETEPRALAVLPFKPLQPGGEDGPLGLGMADALITRLSRLGSVRVRPTNAILKYATAADPQEAGRELHAETVLDGTIQQAGDRVRVSVQLVRVADGAVVWAEVLDEPFTHLFSVQDALSERLARALAVQLSPTESAGRARHPTENLGAYQAYLRGRYFWNKLTGPWLAKARESFETAISLDPGFALAHAGLSDTYTMLGLLGLLHPKEAWRRARDAAGRALEADDTMAEAHVSLAYVRLFEDWDWSGAEVELRSAVALDPTTAAVHQWYALFLAMNGRFPEALREAAEAQKLDPVSLTVSANAGFQLYLTGQHDSEIEQHRRTLELDPDYFLGHWALGLAYDQKAMHAEAIEEHRKSVELSGDSPLMKANLARSYALSRRPEEARSLLSELTALSGDRFVSAYRLATVHVALGEPDAAFACLERACDERDHWMVWLKVDPMLEPLRSDPRFPRVAQRVGFPAEAS